MLNDPQVLDALASEISIVTRETPASRAIRFSSHRSISAGEIQQSQHAKALEALAYAIDVWAQEGRHERT